MILSCKPKNGRVGVNNKSLKMNKFKLLGVTAVLGLSMLFSTPANAKYVDYTCEGGELIIHVQYTILGFNIYTSDAPTGLPCSAME